MNVQPNAHTVTAQPNAPMAMVQAQSITILATGGGFIMVFLDTVTHAGDLITITSLHRLHHHQGIIGVVAHHCYCLTVIPTDLPL